MFCGEGCCVLTLRCAACALWGPTSCASSPPSHACHAGTRCGQQGTRHCRCTHWLRAWSTTMALKFICATMTGATGLVQCEPCGAWPECHSVASLTAPSAPIALGPSASCEPRSVPVAVKTPGAVRGCACESTTMSGSLLACHLPAYDQIASCMLCAAVVRIIHI